VRASKEYRRIINKLRRKYGKKNGVIKGAILDHPYYEKIILSGKKIK